MRQLSRFGDDGLVLGRGGGVKWVFERGEFGLLLRLAFVVWLPRRQENTDTGCHSTVAPRRITRAVEMIVIKTATPFHSARNCPKRSTESSAQEVERGRSDRPTHRRD